jgi:hypothetical protein
MFFINYLNKRVAIQTTHADIDTTIANRMDIAVPNPAKSPESFLSQNPTKATQAKLAKVTVAGTAQEPM